MYTKRGGRKSPPRLSKECKGQIRKGVDGRMWISVKDSSGVYRWQRQSGRSRSRSRSRSRGRSPSRKTASTRGGRPCGTRTRAKCRWTREELERLAIAQGIPYDGLTMDALCSTLQFEDADTETVLALLGSANAQDDVAPYMYGRSGYVEQGYKDPTAFTLDNNRVMNTMTGMPRLAGPWGGHNSSGLPLWGPEAAARAAAAAPSLSP